ncbi:MAG TPA: hypothetical protein VFJ02_12050 [Vicinamibacterales bacterium]|nr:hypothetical protein [Vicinamibacterales bacterium]
MDPFSGTWVANLDKSRRHANHQFHSATLQFDVSGPQISLTQSGINMSGKSESSTIMLHADGQERPVSPQAPGVVVVARWIGTHVLETIGKRSDEIIGRGVYEVSPDGRTLTATVAGVDAQGAPFDQVIVFDRE